MRALESYQPPSDFEPVEAVFTLRTPLIMGFPWIFGDALVARVLMEEQLGDLFYNLPAKAPLPVWKYLRLPIKQTGLIYNASCSLLDTDEKHLTTFYSRYHEDGLESRAKVRVGSGNLRNYMLRFSYSASRTVKFYYCGDYDELDRILSSLDFIGKKGVAGGGEIAKFELNRVDEDRSVTRNCTAMRSIPLTMCKSYNISDRMKLAYRFPSWDQRNVAECVKPGGVCTVMI